MIRGRLRAGFAGVIAARMTAGGWPAILAVLVGSTGALTLSGCNILGPVATVIAGPGKVKREYELDKDKRTVIFVDDPASRVASRSLRAQLGETTQNRLMRKELVRERNMIDTRSALAAASTGTYEDPVTITEIGDELDADIVIYVLMREFTISPDGVTYQPSALMNVSIVDVKNQTQLWPVEAEGFPVSVQPDARPDYKPESRRAMLREERQQLATLAGETLAQVFYTVEVPQSLRR